jgi:hypothetical protein
MIRARERPVQATLRPPKVVKEKYKKEFNYSQRSESLGHQTPLDTTCKFGTQIAYPVLAHAVAIFSDTTAERSRSVFDRVRRQEYDLLHSKARLFKRTDRHQHFSL